MGTLLEIHDLYAGYRQGNDILNRISLTVSKNEILAIVGANGSGKSTIAKSIMNLVPYRKGSVLFEGNEICKTTLSSDKINKSGIGFFMQEGAVFKNLTVEENLTFAVRNMPGSEQKIMIEEIISKNSFLKDKLKTKASNLSGGEKHQLSLAMILIQKPKLLVLDEPSAGLSPINQKIMFDTIDKLRNKNIAILLIEQNVRQAIRIADRTALLKNGLIAKTEKRDNISSIEQFFWDFKKNEKP
jgi:ABC-type branched-subunit amino acid transport system ATPase component